MPSQTHQIHDVKPYGITALQVVVNSNFAVFFVNFIQLCRGLIERDMRNASFLRNITDNILV